MQLVPGFHLTYCLNIHPGETWPEVWENLKTYPGAVRDQLCPGQPFAIGLRLSGQAADALARPENLEAFQEFLRTEGAYVFTINGFPYGVFHRARVKENVYLPDWRDRVRLEYTNRLARILARLLPDDADMEGSISTVPGAFRTEVRSSGDVRRMAELMLRSVAYLHRLREQTGKTITLALEPEPCCFLETTDDVVAFFEGHVFSEEGLGALVRELGLTRARAERVARRHLGICVDACHVAVEFEEPAEVLDRLEAAGIRILKVQVSSALRLRFREGDGSPQRTLRPFAEETYLHQVVETSERGVVRYQDLPQALDREADFQQKGAGSPGIRKEWRVHFHVPIFLSRMRGFDTTQDDLAVLLARLKSKPACPYLEVETYTWDVLPPRYKTLDTTDAIARELAWTRDKLLQ